MHYYTPKLQYVCWHYEVTVAFCTTHPVGYIISTKLCALLDSFFFTCAFDARETICCCLYGAVRPSQTPFFVAYIWTDVVRTFEQPITYAQLVTSVQSNYNFRFLCLQAVLFAQLWFNAPKINAIERSTRCVPTLPIPIWCKASKSTRGPWSLILHRGARITSICASLSPVMLVE